MTTPGQARPDPLSQTSSKAGRTLTARLAPPVVTVGEPAAIVAQLSTAQPGRPLTVERRRDNGSWAPLAEAGANRTGRAAVRLDTSTPGPQVLRVVAEAWRGKPASTSLQVTLRVLTTGSCTPRVALVDPDATTAARCLATRLDRWKAAGLMGVGQQLNMSSDQYAAPLTALGARRVSVVGFDLWELGKTKRYEFPFYDRALADLVAMAQDGAVLTASWHAPNPHTGRSYDDRSWHDLGALLRDTPEADAFWADFDEQLTVLAELQAAGVPVVFRPFHEVNGDWFWWGRPSASTFTKVYAELQERAWAAGVHNVVWAYSFNAVTGSHISDPAKLVPAAVDLAGLDSYWPATGSHRGDQAPSMAGYAAVAKRVPRMAITEVGPLADPRGVWKPSVVTSVARAQRKQPVWALLWVDDAAGLKQISSLTGGPAWLDSCPNAFCVL
ncbi:glycosyl hydrolase [Nocardioides pyridinolyticus]